MISDLRSSEKRERFEIADYMISDLRNRRREGDLRFQIT
jgi:hypothetical protein